MARVFRRNKRYWIDYNDVQGVRHRKQIGPSSRVAGEVLNDILSKVAREEFLGVAQESSAPFIEFAKVWRARVERQLKPRTAERWFGIVKNHLRPTFKGALRAITSATVESYVAKRLEAGANPQTVNRELAVLRHMIKRAVAWNYLARDPISKWPFSKETAFRRVRFLTEEEIPQLLTACGESRSPYLKAFVLVALNTGMRRGEILKLTRRSIDLQNRIATIEDTKNGETAHVPLNDVAFEALRGLPGRLDGRLFPFKDEHSVSRAFKRAVERAGIEDFRLHDLRHTFASYHAMGGVQQRSLQALLRHKDTRMTLRYSHLTEAHLRLAVDAVQLGANTPASPRQVADATG